MAFLDEIVNIQITRGSTGLSSADLNTLLIIGDTKATDATFRIKSYGSIAEVKTNYGVDTLEYKAASLVFSQEITPNKLLIGQKLEADANYADAYFAIKDINDNFYGVCILSKTHAAILAVAAAVEADKKLFGVSTNEAEALLAVDTVSIAKKLFNLNFLRSFVLYSKGIDVNNNDKAEAGWMSLMLSKLAGSATWAYKTISGVVPDNLNSTARNSLESKNANYYINVGQVATTYNGKTAGGEWIDVIAGLDWLENNLKISVFNALSAVDKIPYTNDGIAILESVVRVVAQQAAAMGILDPESIVVTAPNARDIAPSFKASRTLPDLKLEATLAGAIHLVQIKAIISI